MDENNKIIIKGAREHNLKNIDLEFPRDSFTVITGLSGSGKSSLAFDTIYAEGQRRYIESLSAYARQFLDQLEKPDVDSIKGLSPAISIEQKAGQSNPRSTVGTVTEIYDYFRLLYSKVGHPHCPECGREVQRQTAGQMAGSIKSDFDGEKIEIYAPLIRGRKGHYRELFEDILKEGYLKARVDGEILSLEEGMKLDRYKVHDIEVLVDKLVVSEKSSKRLDDSLELAIGLGKGTLNIVGGSGRTRMFSKYLSCPYCGISFPELAPNSFSFNTPYGSCPECGGMGQKRELDANLIIPDFSKSINEGAIEALGKPRGIWLFSQIEGLGLKFGFDFDTKLSDFSEEQLKLLLHGSKEKIPFTYRFGGNRDVTYMHRYNGIVHYINHFYETTSSNKIRDWAESFMNVLPCSLCHGGRLKKESLSVTIGGLNISELCSLSVENALNFVKKIEFSERESLISQQIMKEIRSRLGFLLNVGLDYLSLGRSARTLSGGEAQRIRLATQIGSQLSGVLYVLDEPSIGLHQSDNLKLIHSLKKLRDMGNTVVVVEHDRETIESADFIVDLGPLAGAQGGEICMAGYRNDIMKQAGKSLTVDYLTRKKKIELPEHRRSGNGSELFLSGCRGNNLKSVDISIPLGTLCLITGVSGSGKSTLINETLVPILMKKFHSSKLSPLPYEKIEGLESLDKLIEIDQSPIGRTPRSNPATYTGVFTHIRDLFAQIPESKMKGYGPGRFSFNVKGGRCEDCQGDGLKKIEMNFLPDLYVECESCHGKRYNRETLEVLYKGKSIAEVLDMTVSEALQFFEDHQVIKRKLKAIKDVGLGYIKLGQQATSLSGGEAQRVKLASELSKVSTGKTVYVLDEPTTGLHFEDIRILLKVLNKLVDKGNTVIVIEHNLDVIKVADYIIDLGPKGGDHGGSVVASGTPEEVSENDNSLTGKYLKIELKL